jgi:hypothetical protein
MWYRRRGVPSGELVTDWSEAFIAAGIVLSPLLVRRALRRRSAS